MKKKKNRESMVFFFFALIFLNEGYKHEFIVG